MLKSIGKNKKYIFWVAVFGLAGLLLIPAVRYMIKLSRRYPKVFKWINVGILGIFGLICIYGFLFKQEWNMSLICICIALAIGSVQNNNSR